MPFIFLDRDGGCPPEGHGEQLDIQVPEGGGGWFVQGSIFGDTVHGRGGDDTFWGYQGDDVFFGHEGDDHFVPKCLGSAFFDGHDYADGGGGNDVLDGGNGNDTLFGRSGNDKLIGGEGDDSLVPGTGYDTIDGGAGIDMIDYLTSGHQSGWTIILEQSVSDGVRYGLAMRTGALETDWLVDIENVSGSGGDDVIVGSSTHNLLRGNAGDDNIVGGGGNDTIDGGMGIDTLDGGDGRDTVSFQTSLAGVTVSLAWQFSYTSGQPAEQLISFENVIGSQHADSIYGDNGFNVLRGERGADYIDGEGGNDILYGGEGNDTLEGGDGRDRLNGDDGDDTLIGDVKHSELLSGGRGRDTADYSADTHGVTVVLDSIGTAEKLDGTVEGVWYPTGPEEPGITWTDTLRDIENVTGGSGDDFIFGSTDKNGNVLRGGDGQDEIFGAGGNDTIFGDLGDDTIHGAFGSSAIDGGDGVDHLTYVNLATGMVINLTNGTATFRDDEAEEKLDTIADIEIATGTQGNDFIMGASGSETLFGGAGDDTIAGRGGADFIDGGEGRDRIIYDQGDGDDVVVFNAEEDVLDLSTWGFLTFSEFADDFSETTINGETAVVFTGDPFGGTLTLLGTSFAELESGNLLF